MRKNWSLRLCSMLCALAVAGLFASCATEPENTDLTIKDSEKRVILCSGLDSSNKPLNNLPEISMKEDAMFIYSTFFKIPNGRHLCEFTVYNGSSEVVYYGYLYIKVEKYTHDTWCSYKFNRNVDSPGLWKCVISLDKVKMVEKEIRVTE